MHELPIFFFFCVVLYILASCKKIKQNYCAVIRLSNKKTKVAGPGIVFVPLFFQSTKDFNLSAQKQTLPAIRFSAQSKNLLSGNYTARIFDPLKASAVEDPRMQTNRWIEHILLELMQTATIRDCLLEKSFLEVLALELINEKTKTWGVQISALSISDFPMHKFLLNEVICLPYFVFQGVATLIEQCAEENAIIP